MAGHQDHLQALAVQLVLPPAQVQPDTVAAVVAGTAEPVRSAAHNHPAVRPLDDGQATSSH